MPTGSNLNPARLSRHDGLKRIWITIGQPSALVACIAFTLLPPGFGQILDAHEAPFRLDWTGIPSIEVARLPVGHISILRLKALRHTLSDAMKLLGGGAIEKDRAESAPNRLCFCAANTKDNLRLVFYSGSSGGWEQITGFALLGGDSDLERCRNSTQSTVVSKAISTASGLKLGMTRWQFEGVIGYRPSRVAGDRVFYHFHAASRAASVRADRRMTSAHSSNGADLSVDYDCFIEAIFSKGILVALSVNETATT